MFHNLILHLFITCDWNIIQKYVLLYRGIGIYSHVLEHLQKLARDAQTDGQAVTIADFISQLQVNTISPTWKVNLRKLLLQHYQGANLITLILALKFYIHPHFNIGKSL